MRELYKKNNNNKENFPSFRWPRVSERN